MPPRTTPRTPGALLEVELERRKKSNPRYSLRAFAKFLDLSPSFLSHVIGGTKKLSVAAAKPVTEKLGWRGHRSELFILAVRFELADSDVRPLLRSKMDVLTTRSKAKRLAAEGSLSELSWSHLLLLVCVEFQPELSRPAMEGLAAFTGLERARLAVIVRQLVGAGLLVESDGRFERTEKQLVLDPSAGASALKKLHADYLGRALSLLSERPPERRYSATEFASVPASEYPALRAKVDDLLDEISSRSVAAPRDSVVEIAVHLNLFHESEIFSAATTGVRRTEGIRKAAPSKGSR